MPRPKRSTTPLTLLEAMERIQEGLKAQVNRPNIYAYKPHSKQHSFHKSSAYVTLYIGGNRSGKTVGGAVESVYRLLGKHPYKKIPEAPVRGRAIAVDFNYGVDMIMIPQISQYVPPSYLINGSWEDSYDREHRLLTLTNKSTLEFRSYEQDLDKFAGTSRHFMWFDEEPPKHIYTECMARLVDTNGIAYLTMTPLDGMTWVYEDLYTKGLEGDPNIQVISIDMLENPYISQEAATRYLNTLDKDERDARKKGEFVTVGGKVFKSFSTDIHVVDTYIPPTEWEWYVSFDHGYNNPTAILWHAVSPDGQIVTFAEHYKAEMTVPQHAVVFHEKNKAFKRLPDFVVGDPAMSQRNGVTGTSIMQEYADRDIYIAAGNNDVDSGVNRMIQYLDHSEGLPRWTITSNCVNLIAELKKLRWASFASKKVQYDNNKREKIHKKDDHAFDSARYFFSCMPDLTGPGIEITATNGTTNPWDLIAAPASTGAPAFYPSISTTKWDTTVADILYEND